MTRMAVFAYGSLASLESAARTLGRPVELAALARLQGWRRGWAAARDNLACEKTFARVDDGELPPWCVGLTLERIEPEDRGQAPNGALIEATGAELDRLDLREMRYDRVDVTAGVRVAGRDQDAAATGFDRVYAYVAKAQHHFPTPPPGAVILANYVRAVEEAFESLGPGQLALFRETTGPYPVELIDAVLVRDDIPTGNPRAW